MTTATLSEKRVALIATMFGAFLTPFMGSAINIALPVIGKEFHLTALTVNWIATAYLLTASVFLVPLGRLADIYGRRRVFTLGTLIFSISSLICALVNSAPLLIAARILQGIGSPMIFGTGVAILTSVYPAGEKGKALGYNTAAVYFGLSIGPVLGGFLTQQFGWRAIFYAATLFGICTFLLVTARLKGEWAEARGERFDLTGSLIYGIVLVALMYGFSRLPHLAGFLLVGGSLLGMLVFIEYESRIAYPVINLQLFRNNAVFAFSNLAALINYAATFAVGFLMSFYLQAVKELNPQQAGMVLIIQPLIQSLFSPLTGRLSDRIEPRWVASFGMAVTALGLFSLTFLTADTALLAILVALGAIGFGFAFFSSPNSNAVMGSVARQYYGVAAGTLGTMRLVGQMFSLGIALLIFAVYLGEIQIAHAPLPQLLTSMRVAFGIFAGLCGLGIVASLLRGKRNRE